ncbi:hypothetical protein GGD54_002849 [Rhizobium tropici]|uniref:Uncharacterized protein n=1 Tax=Rhizobium tropici TaxID=398 RepID=A0ABR6QZS7_RHITR|nr:hypothetical protein [Rhizobium tropici]MBB5593856.1 hypothetical protein [Rhizobium tropici]MBB6492444.1 hypothetical protein [Rhizobium tropici]
MRGEWHSCLAETGHFNFAATTKNQIIYLMELKAAVICMISML